MRQTHVFVSHFFPRDSRRKILCGSTGGCPLGVHAVHANVALGLDAGRSRLTFHPLARCSRGAFINSSVLIRRIDEWLPLAILCTTYTLV